MRSSSRIFSNTVAIVPAVQKLQTARSSIIYVKNEKEEEKIYFGEIKLAAGRFSHDLKLNFSQTEILVTEIFITCLSTQ